MTGIGEADASLFLARFVLLSIEAIGQSATVARLIAEAGEGLPNTNVPAATRERQDD
ncbi:hypothetical protein [Burkholderia sp. Bp8992]|uniref:hypothetical protein n=1 Tax=Burkholderia sp. Bp8992 TaxID=2184554 RepID=UPI0016294C21|nr:hypothetical protein [Burkholderia sp. Bp8992]